MACRVEGRAFYLKQFVSLFKCDGCQDTLGTIAACSMVLIVRLLLGRVVGLG